MLNIILLEAQRLFFPNEDLLQRTFHKWTNVHRTSESVEFLKACIYKKVIPVFSRLSPHEVQSLRISSTEKLTIENRTLLYERNKKSENLASLLNDFDILSNEILFLCENPFTHFKLISFIKILVKKFESRSDERRSKKFNKLVETRDAFYNTAIVYNRTDVEIPSQVLDLLKFGKNLGVGAPFSDSTNILEIDKLFNCFEYTARQNNISELLIGRIKSLSALTGLDIDSCKTDDSRVTALKNFLKKYPENILLRVDKSPDLIYVQKADYLHKITNFLGSNFEKMEKYELSELEKDVESYRSLINETFQNCLPKTVVTNMHPLYSISDFYGMYKCHKKDKPIRGIVTSFNSLVCNSENFIQTLIQPIVDECEFAVDSLGDFKTKFLKEKTKFIEREHKLVSVDVVNMYNNVNVPRVISHILDKIYSNPRKFFKFKNENNVLLPVPTRENLKLFLLDTFRKYSIFRSPIGVYKQKSGLGMGSAISASISTIFVNLMEQSVVKPF